VNKFTQQEEMQEKAQAGVGAEMRRLRKADVSSADDVRYKK